MARARQGGMPAYGGAGAWIEELPYTFPLLMPVDVSACFPASLLQDVSKLVIGVTTNKDDMRGTVSIDAGIKLVKSIPNAAGVFVWTAEFSKNGFNFQLERKVFDLYKSVEGVSGKCFEECTSNYKQEDTADIGGNHQRKCTYQRICPSGFKGPSNPLTGGTDCFKPPVKGRGAGYISQSACGSNCEKCLLLWWVCWAAVAPSWGLPIGCGAPRGFSALPVPARRIPFPISFLMWPLSWSHRSTAACVASPTPAPHPACLQVPKV